MWTPVSAGAGHSSFAREPPYAPWLPAGGYLAHSLAIMTDAAHLLADVGSMAASLFSLWLSTRPATRTMTFGWHRSGMA